MVLLRLLAFAGSLVTAPASASAVYPRFRPGAAVVDDAVHGDHFELARNVPIKTPPHAQITAAPLIPQELLRKRATSVVLPSCAVSCFESAVESHSPCTVGDLSCGCQYSNALAISSAAEPCLEAACGYLTAFYAYSTLEVACASVAQTAVYTVATTPPAAGGTTAVGQTKTAVAGGGGATSTSSSSGSSNTGSSGSTGSDSGSGSTSGDSGTSNSNTSSSSSDSLSKGAIAGIAVGAAGGAIIICAILFLIYRCTARNKGSAAAANASEAHGGGGAAAPSVGGGGGDGAPAAGDAAAGATAANVSPLSVAAVPVPVGNELDGKSSAVVSTTAATTPTPTPSGPLPSTQSVSPATSNGMQNYAVPVAGQAPLYPAVANNNVSWQQQQQYSQPYAQPQMQQQPYLVQGYTIAPGQPPQPQATFAAPGYAAAHPSQPLPGVIYQEAPPGIPQSHYPQELSGQPFTGRTYEMPTATPVPRHASPASQHVAPAAPVGAIIAGPQHPPQQQPAQPPPPAAAAGASSDPPVSSAPPAA